MMILPHWTYGLLVLIVSALITTAYDLSTERTPHGPLQVRIDYNVARPAGSTPSQASNKDIRTVIFTSHLSFSQDVSAFSDGQLVQIGFDAYEEMLVELSAYGFTQYAKPSVMTVFAIGQEIFLATSQKGMGSFINRFPDSPVKKSLALCQAIYSDGSKGNMHKSNCGEIMAAHSYFRSHPTATTMKGLGGRTVTVEKAPGLKIKAPCGTSEDVSSPL